jgi:predicted AAA+ superfamily ATPase
MAFFSTAELDRIRLWEKNTVLFFHPCKSAILVDMHGYIDRSLQSRITQDLALFPAVVLLGLRQSGKSTFRQK